MFRIVFLAISCLACTAFVSSVRIKSNVGEIIGRVEDVTFNGETRQSLQFLGIPYAEPPVGPRRFKKPEPKGNFAEVFNATSFGDACFQHPYMVHGLDIKTSEDCLSLNIYVPYGTNGARASNVAVMIYIYGGGFNAGWSSMYDGSALSSFNDVIVVTMNYRLSVFGFLTSGDTNAPGNYGLWDQHLAIKWVHDNVAAFGGDTGRVTLFGQSAGSASVLYQALYLGNKGYFQRVIGQSGSPLSSWALGQTPDEVLRNFSVQAGCSQHVSTELMKCLRSKSASEILNVMSRPDSKMQLVLFEFGPVVDGDFIKSTPEDTFSMKSSKAHDVMTFFGSLDLMAGFNEFEAAIGVSVMCNATYDQFNTNGCPRQVFRDFTVPFITKTLFQNDLPVMNETFIFQYTNWTYPDDPFLTRAAVAQMVNDFSIFVPVMRVAEYHAMLNSSTTSFVYQFSPKLLSNFPRPDWITGASHAEELNPLFGFQTPYAIFNLSVPWPPLPTSEIELSKYMMKLWTNFAKSGNPNSPVDTSGYSTTAWPEYKTTTKQLLDIDVPMSRNPIKSNVFATQLAFWTRLVPAILDATTGPKHPSHGHSLPGAAGTMKADGRYTCDKKP